MSLPPVVIIVPLYRSAHLIPPLFDNLHERASELKANDCEILFINDSPDDAELRATLSENWLRLADKIAITLITNEKNLGFIKSTNWGLRHAISKGADALLLNSDVLLMHGTVSELRNVCYADQMISAACPRSNNATICNLPYQSLYRDVPLNHAFAAYEQTAIYMPRYSYVPTIVGFCMYIKITMLLEFGLLDEAYGKGYNEENDFLMRCNARGYSPVIANHAYAYHLGSVSFSSADEGKDNLETRNAKLLKSRYPFYSRSLARFYNGPEYRSQVLLEGMIKTNGKYRILFECSNIGPYHNGTFEHAKRLIAAFCKGHSSSYEIAIRCSNQSYIFHEFNKVEGLNFIEDIGEDQAFTIAFRIGQPFSSKDYILVNSNACISGFLFLDTIAMDCQNIDEHDLRSLWGYLPDFADLIGFNSQFTSSQYKRRFGQHQEIHHFTTMCSLDLADYSFSREKLKDLSAERVVLLIGNKFSHKFVPETLEKLLNSTFEGKIVVLGGIPVPGTNDSRVTYVESGQKSDGELQKLYTDCDVVLFPSHYEGFGLPVMHALSHKKPVVVRDIPVFHEIASNVAGGHNIHLCPTTDDMINLINSDLQWQGGGMVALTYGWEAAADDLNQAFVESIRKFSFRRLLEKQRRLNAVFTAGGGPQNENLSTFVDRLVASLAEQWSNLDEPMVRPVIHHSQKSYAAASSKVVHQDGDTSLEYSKSASFFRKPQMIRLARRSAPLDFSMYSSLAEQGDNLQVSALSAERWEDVISESRSGFSYLAIRNVVPVRSVEAAARIALFTASKTDYSGVITFALSTRTILASEAQLFERVIKLLFANAGCRILSLGYYDRCVVIAAEKTRVWTSFAMSADSDGFLDDLYSAAFGRKPDEEGANVHRQSLAGGRSYLDIAIAVFGSSERLRLIFSQPDLVVR